MLPISRKEYDALVTAFGLNNAESGVASGAE
jgi:hypothetical protein